MAHVRRRAPGVDGSSSWWVNTHGHAHPKIAEAIAEQAAGLIGSSSPTLATHLRRMAATRVGSTGDLNHVFFSDNGSTSVEVALKMALQATQLGQKQRRHFVAFEGAYMATRWGDERGRARSLQRALLELVVRLPCCPTMTPRRSESTSRGTVMRWRA